MRSKQERNQIITSAEKGRLRNHCQKSDNPLRNRIAQNVRVNEPVTKRLQPISRTEPILHCGGLPLCLTRGLPRVLSGGRATQRGICFRFAREGKRRFLG